ncbi:MAG: hypothetical protein H6668_23285 [Ardenticatenaceae bacterium]|nr:hypothetical protein [Ardenticatenaceae bacterium]
MSADNEPMPENKDAQAKNILWGKLLLFGMTLVSVIFGVNFDTLSLIKLNQAYSTYLSSVWLILSAILSVGLVMGVYVLIRFEETIVDNLRRRNMVMLFPMLPVFLVIFIYLFLIKGVPLWAHMYEDVESVKIRATVLEKKYDSSRNARRGYTCRYKIYFEYEDIAGKSYICTDKGVWEMFAVGEEIVIEADKTSLSYWLKSVSIDDA